jgi:hypothetical protein
MKKLTPKCNLNNNNNNNNNNLFLYAFVNILNSSVHLFFLRILYDIYVCRVIASKRTQTALKGMENAPFAQSFSFVIKEKSPEDILVHVYKYILPTLTKY